MQPRLVFILLGFAIVIGGLTAHAQSSVSAICKDGSG